MRFLQRNQHYWFARKSKISTEDGKTLETEQLYFDQKKRMVLQKENLNYQIQRELPMGKESILAKTLKW
jgi:hypothetical protein